MFFLFSPRKGFFGIILLTVAVGREEVFLNGCCVLDFLAFLMNVVVSIYGELLIC